MKSILLVTFGLIFSSFAHAQSCSPLCVNTSGNSAYDALCQAYGAQGLCGDMANICTQVPRQLIPGVSRCVNTSGNSAYDAVCQAYGAQGLCGDMANICTQVPGELMCR
jgi:hypothetical protein